MAKAKKQLLSNKESNQVSTPWFSVFLHKGSGPFSFQSQYQQEQPVTLVLINKGESIWVEADPGQAIQLYSSRCQVFSTKGLEARFSYEGFRGWEFFEIKVSHSFLNELPASVCHVWDSFKKKSEKNKIAVLSDSNLYNSAALKYLTYTLLVQQYNDPSLQLYYLSLKMKEILLHVLNESQFPEKKDYEVTTKQLQLVSKAKKLLDKTNLIGGFTNKSLAAALKTNETTLKQAFKKVEGTTAYKYHVQKQMHRAQKLLLQGYPVAKVSEMIGYSHASHFSVGFKNIFGLSPENVKKKI